MAKNDEPKDRYEAEGMLPVPTMPNYTRIMKKIAIKQAKDKLYKTNNQSYGDTPEENAVPDVIKGYKNKLSQARVLRQLYGNDLVPTSDEELKAKDYFKYASMLGMSDYMRDYFNDVDKRTVQMQPVHYPEGMTKNEVWNNAMKHIDPNSNNIDFKAAKKNLDGFFKNAGIKKLTREWFEGLGDKKDVMAIGEYPTMADLQNGTLGSVPSANDKAITANNKIIVHTHTHPVPSNASENDYELVKNYVKPQVAYVYARKNKNNGVPNLQEYYNQLYNK